MDGLKNSPTDLDFLEEILEQGVDETVEFIHKIYKVPEQKGPVRFFDATLHCASRGCSSPTHFKLQGVPYCMIHVVWKLNDMLLELGVEK